MSGSVNKVILIGNLGADPEIRRTQAGDPIANLRIATSETWRDRNTGERKERTEWHRVVVFNEGLAKVCEQYLKKGSKVYIEGQLQTRDWEDQQNQKRYTTEIVLKNFGGTLTMLSSPRDSGDDDGPGDYQNRSGAASGNGRRQDGQAAGGGRSSGFGGSGGGGFGGGGSDFDDEIPFAPNVL